MIRKMGKISTGSESLDCLFKYDSSLLTMVYGEAATGKTTLALLATIALAREKKRVIFIDTENGFSVERLKQLAPDYESFISYIVHIHPTSLAEQERIVNSLPEKTTKIIIIDTIGFFYRVEVKQDPYKANKCLDNQLKRLYDLTKKGTFVFLTNQVYATMDGKVNAVGGDMVKNWSKYMICLFKNPRKLKVEKPFTLELVFEIQGKGILVKEAG